MGRGPPDERAERGFGATLLGLALGLAFLAAAVPVAAVNMPPLLDYPNHAARLWLIGGGANQPPLDRFYAVDWSRASTNVGVDLMAALLAGPLGPANVAPLCLALAIALPSLGALLLNRRAFGGAHPWQLAFVVPAFGKTLLAGFMNFHLSLGLALIFAAGDEAVARLGAVGAFVVRAVLTSIVLIFHPFGGLTYGGLLAALAIGRDRLAAPGPVAMRGKMAAVVLAVLPALIPVILIQVFAPHPPVAIGGEGPVLDWNHGPPLDVAAHSVARLFLGFHAYSPGLDALAVLTLAGVVAVAWAQKRLAVHFGLLLAGLAFAALSLVMPTRIGDAYWVEYRLPIIALFVLLAAVRPDPATTPRGRALLAGGLLALGLGRTAVVGAAWLSEQRDVRAVRQALASVPAGSAILPVDRHASAAQRARAPFGRSFGPQPSFTCLPALAVPERRAFVPGLYAIAGQQPLRVRDGWSALSGRMGCVLPSPAELGQDRADPRFPYVRRWRSFDYILLMDADLPPQRGEVILSGAVDLVSDAGFAALYRIRHPGTQR